MITLKDRCKQKIATNAGIGSVTLTTQVTGFKTISSALSNGDVSYFCLESANGDWEVFVGTYTANGATISRDVILASSNSGNKIDIGTSITFCFITYPADKTVYNDANDKTVIGASGLIFSDASVQTTASTTPDLSGYATTAAVAATYLPLAGGTMTGLLTITQATANTGIISSTGYSLTGSDATSAINFAGTWNTSGTPTLLKYNVTDTASNVASLLFDLQVGGTSKFKVDKAGGGTMAGMLTINAPVSGDSLTINTNTDVGVRIQHSSNPRLALWRGGTERLRLNAIGNVGTVTGNGGLSLGGAVDATHLNISAAGAITASGNLTLQNSTTAVLAEISKTYTSATDREYLGVGYVSGISAYFLGSRRAASGSNQALKIGHLAADGATFVGAIVDTNGYLSAKRIIGDTSTPTGFTFTTALATCGGQMGWAYTVGVAPQVLTFSPTAGVIQFTSTGSTPLVRFALGSTGSATAPSFKPYSGGVEIRAADDSASLGLTCASITASGTLTLQNSTTAVLAEISKTYTSGTDREYLGLGYVSGISAYFLGSRRAASGSNQALKIGHLAADGTTFAGLTVDTTGNLTVPPYFSITMTGGMLIKSDGNARIGLDYSGRGIQVGSSKTFGIPNQAVLNGMASDVIFRRNATGPAWIAGADGGFQIRNLADSADAALTCAAITASGQITQVPPASATLATNGQFTLEMTSNTAGNLVYRGSDGTTRRMALVFV